MPPKDIIAVQHQVKHNAQELQDYFSDLSKWEANVKQKDQKLLKGDLNPTRGQSVPGVRKKGFAEMVPSGMTGPKDEERAKAKAAASDEPIKPKNYQDYRQWDKFIHKDLDKMLEDFDENDRQEQEAKHREKLAEERRKIEEKEAAARKALDEAEQLKNLGNELLKAGNLQGAVEKYSQAIEKDNKNHIAYANRAQAYLSLGELDLVVRDCCSAVLFCPRYVKAYLRRAAAYQRMEPIKKEEAIADLRKALLLEPNNKQAKADLEKLTRPPPTAEELAEMERLEAEEKARLEKERRKKERGGRKLMIREVDGSEETLKAQEEKMQKLLSENQPSAAQPAGAETSPSQQAPQPEEATIPQKKILNLEDAKELAAAAKEAVQAKLKDTELGVPKTSVEFQRAWKRVKDQPEQLGKWLLQIPPAKFVDYFRADLDEDILVSILGVVRTRLLDEDAQASLGILQGLIVVPRIGITMKFLAKDQKQSLYEILEGLDQRGMEEAKGLKAKFDAAMSK